MESEVQSDGPQRIAGEVILRILLATHKFWPSLGGTQQLSLGIARGLTKRGHEVTVMTSMTRSTSKDEWYEGIHVRRFRRVNVLLKRPWYITPGMVAASLDGEWGSYDIVHAFHFVTFQALLSACFAELTNTRFVLTPSYHPWRGAYEIMVARRVIRRADAVVAQCSQEKDRLSSFIPPSKIATIPCGVDEAQFTRTNRTDLRAQLGFTSNDKVILYVGDVGGHKSVSKLISIMPLILRSVPHAKLLLVGGGSGHARLRALASSLGIEQAVKVTGQLEEDELRSAFRQSDAFAMPSENESFGIVLLEAAVSGLPIVSTSVGVAPELVRSGSNGYLARSCDSEFAEKLVTVLKEGAFRENAIRMAPTLLTQYSWGTITASLEELYERVLNGSEHGAPQMTTGPIQSAVNSMAAVNAFQPSGLEKPGPEGGE